MLIPFPNQAKHDAQRKTSPTKVCHIEQSEKSRVIMRFLLAVLVEIDEAARFTFEIEMELQRKAGTKKALTDCSISA